MEHWQELLVLATAAGAAAVCAIVVYRSSLASRWAADSQGPRAHAAPTAFVLTSAVVYAAVATVFTINHHHNLGTNIFDLAIYDNLFWQTAHGRPLGTTLIASGYHTAAHFDPLLILFSPLYLLYPRAELLLGLQSIWIASSVIPLYLLARRELAQSWPAALLASALLLHPGLHGANFYDFHSLSFVAPLFLWALYFIETRAHRSYWIVFGLMLLTREDVPLLTCFLGLYILQNDRGRNVGILTIVLSVAYFVAARLYIASVAGDGAQSYAYYYDGLRPDSGGGFGAILLHVLSNPYVVAQQVLQPQKLFFLTIVFLPVLFLPLIASRGRILMIVGLAVTLLASRSAVYSVHFQYPSLLYPAVFFLMAVALGGLGEHPWMVKFGLDAKRLRPALVTGVLVSSLVVSLKFGGLVPNDTFRSGFGPFLPHTTAASRETYAWVERTAAAIPANATVSASWHLAPHVSNRFAIYPFPADIDSLGWGADYVLVDRDDLDPSEREFVDRLLRSRSYDLVREHDQRFMLLRRLRLPDPAWMY